MPQHLRHHVRVGDDQHRQRADAHHRVAQAHRQARADDRLHQRRVGGQARQHLAGLRRLEELGALPDDVGVDRVAQVGGDALAEPAHHVEARRREHAERHADREQREEVARAAPSRARPGRRRRSPGRSAPCSATGKTSVADRREHEEQGGKGDAPAVGTEEGQQAASGRTERLPAGASAMMS